MNSVRSKIVLLLTLIALVSVTTVYAATASKTVVLDVPGMTCKFCPITIRKALKKVPGVISAKAEYKTKTATVTFDSNKTDVDALIKATTNAGYPSKLKQNK